MSATSIYRSARGQAEVLALYEQKEVGAPLMRFERIGLHVR